MNARHWELINLTTWKLERDEYTAVIVHDKSLGTFKPAIMQRVSHQYETVTTLEKADNLYTAMWRCKNWLKRSRKASKKQ